MKGLHLDYDVDGIKKIEGTEMKKKYTILYSNMYIQYILKLKHVMNLKRLFQCLHSYIIFIYVNSLGKLSHCYLGRMKKEGKLFPFFFCFILFLAVWYFTFFILFSTVLHCNLASSM